MSMPKYRIIINGENGPIITDFEKLKKMYVDNKTQKNHVEVTQGTKIITGLMDEVTKNASEKKS